ncbi:uncharacterized protein LOC100904327 [Galendromus occidentalis]|uniref:Uncharacterized protein LOC100904327 n=1 Tax=Galendromus occidentalis TaxID=34638 RepID=A0AAJ6QSW0_9ACAR|nr:uncharacterized protein LOC100904327 [Galendromus occidentalis]
MDTSNGDVVNITTSSQQGNSYFRETQQVFTTSTPNGQHTSVKTVTYTARQSTDSGIDNPFRPEGELSMEADEIVKAIKEGRPFDSIDSGRVSRQANGSLTTRNGSAKSPSGRKDAKPGVVDVQRGIVVPPSDAQQVEQVVLKKKPKCKCCVIQ